jgi:hypothetical protein
MAGRQQTGQNQNDHETMSNTAMEVPAFHFAAA